MFEEERGRHFPAELVSGVTVRPVDAGTLEAVLDGLADRVFTSLPELGNYEQPEQRRGNGHRLHEIHAGTHRERFVFYAEGGQPVGWHEGFMVEPETFFMMYSGVLPSYQRGGVYTTFLRALLPYLRDLGYERVTSNHTANNRAVLIAKLKAGFHITGTFLDERFGAQVSLSYYFHEDRRRGFASAFGLESYGDVPEYAGPA